MLQYIHLKVGGIMLDIKVDYPNAKKYGVL